VFFLAAQDYHDFMVNLPSSKSIPFDHPAKYKINVQGRIAPDWSDRLEGMTICQTSMGGDIPVTTLEGELSDQTALAGVLNTLYELHLPVISVERLTTGQSEESK
jgi:hypothetical protein